ncbi:hypothetical protein L207DRAFT_433688 [Hyaloscypha variabilis F]|uniref:RRM domain-containing protein n=1 Tax=Hyaloscypha variabilis (strain UAMH 11265 / GT02V1 / F) TaxID=1149755 RepID=A0A2J6RER7_HYAVF|nr:hypothetical protein L207DRAFT_433688 [Hyaloscypha variabilis F]
MPLVPAGDETGEYYIIVCGLPWNTSWQKLKDFARNQQPDGTYIEIDHAMIYPQNQTNGWVRVRGKDSFLRALAHLNGGELDHKALIADGRNETQPVMLCDLGVVASPSQRRDSTSTDFSVSSGYQQYGGQLMQPFLPQETYSEWNQQPQSNYSPVSPVFSNGGYYQPPSPIYESPPNNFLVTQPVNYFTAVPQPSIVYAGNMPPATPVYVPPRQPVYPCFPTTYTTGLMSPPSTVRSSSQTPLNTVTGPVVQTEARKVIIKGLPRDTREDALITHINQVASKASSSRSHRSSSSAIQHIDFARHSDGRLKGHAFVIFETHRIAKKVVDTLDGQKFQGRQLRATLAKEGVEPFEAFHQHQQQHGYHTPDSSSRMSQSPSLAGGRVDEKEYRDTQWNNNGEGSSKSAKGKEKPRENSGEDRGRKSRPKSKEPTRGAPAVVDGSGRKRH